MTTDLPRIEIEHEFNDNNNINKKIGNNTRGLLPISITEFTSMPLHLALRWSVSW